MFTGLPLQAIQLARRSSTVSDVEDDAALESLHNFDGESANGEERKGIADAEESDIRKSFCVWLIKS